MSIKQPEGLEVLFCDELTWCVLIFRYEHTKPLIQEEEDVTTVNPDEKIYPSVSSDLASFPDETIEEEIVELEAEDLDLAAAGVGVEDWVNAVEFVPGQPYCGRGKLIMG